MRNIQYANYAFVASTLPYSFLDKNIDQIKIGQIFVASNDLVDSYINLRLKHPNLKITLLPKKRITQFIFLFIKLFESKFLPRKIIFFHECCWVMFDILVKILRPKCEFHPQVTMGNFPQINPREYLPKKKFIFLNLIGFFYFFKSHKQFSDRDNIECVIFSVVKYPKSVCKFPILSRKRIELPNQEKTNKIIFLLGSDNCEDRELVILFDSILQDLLNLGYQCYFKNHPRQNARLRIDKSRLLKKIIQIDPEIPVESIEDDFLCAIGVGSIALLHFGTRGISILNLINFFSNEVRENKEIHLKKHPDGMEIKFVDSFEQLLKYIEFLKDEK